MRVKDAPRVLISLEIVRVLGTSCWERGERGRRQYLFILLSHSYQVSFLRRPQIQIISVCQFSLMVLFADCLYFVHLFVNHFLFLNSQCDVILAILNEILIKIIQICIIN